MYWLGLYKPIKSIEISVLFYDACRRYYAFVELLWAVIKSVRPYKLRLLQYELWHKPSTALVLLANKIENTIGILWNINRNIVVRAPPPHNRINNFYSLIKLCQSARKYRHSCGNSSIKLLNCGRTYMVSVVVTQAIAVEDRNTVEVLTGKVLEAVLNWL